MAVYKDVNTLASEDAAYIAGIIDGEGSISLTRRHRNEKRQLVVSISNNERALLDFVLQTVGAGKITRKRTYGENHADAYTYGISNRQALNLLEQITPFLKSYKASRARLVLDHYVRLTPRNGKYNQTMLRERAQFVEKFFELLP